MVVKVGHVIVDAHEWCLEVMRDRLSHEQLREGRACSDRDALSGAS